MVVTRSIELIVLVAVVAEEVERDMMVGTVADTMVAVMAVVASVVEVLEDRMDNIMVGVKLVARAITRDRSDTQRILHSALGSDSFSTYFNP